MPRDSSGLVHDCVIHAGHESGIYLWDGWRERVNSAIPILSLKIDDVAVSFLPVRDDARGVSAGPGGGCRRWMAPAWLV